MNTWFVLSILLFGLVLLWFISHRKSLSSGARKVVADQWDKIEDLYDKKRFKEAILEADKTFDFVLKRMNLSGLTLGDRLKHAKSLLNNEDYHRIWQAHKYRNKLVHEINYNADQKLSRKNLDVFKQTIRSLKAF